MTESEGESLRGSCVACGKTRDEWSRGRVMIGELTRGDVNRDRAENGLGPLCGAHDCKMERSGELLDMYGTLSKAARFGGPGWREL